MPGVSRHAVITWPMCACTSGGSMRETTIPLSVSTPVTLTGRASRSGMPAKSWFAIGMTFF